MFFPLSDDDRQLIKPAFVTWTLIALNGLVFLLQLSDPDFTYGYAAVPAEITSGRDLVEPIDVQTPGGSAQIPQLPGPWPIQLTLLTSMFMHGGFGHLSGNMLYLWIFGDNVEHRFGHAAFLAFYLVSGLVGSIAHIAMSPDSVIPTLGASGAISGVLGAYLVLFPRNRVYAVFLLRMVTVPAAVVLVMWAVMQVAGGFGNLSQASESGGVAYAAHIGGFAAGVAMAIFFRVMWPQEPSSVFQRRYALDPQSRRWW